MYVNTYDVTKHSHGLSPFATTMPRVELGDDFTHPNMSFVSAHRRCCRVEKDLMI